MNKSILLFISIILFYIFISNVIANNNLIPEDAIRIRVIPNSNSNIDQSMKSEVKELLQNYMYNLLKNVKGVNNAKELISSHLGALESKISNLFLEKNYNRSFELNYGLNYFPEKEYKGITYDEGYYESLVVTIGEGQGDNWWCVLFPPLCLIEAEESTDIEYTSLIKEIIDEYM